MNDKKILVTYATMCGSTQEIAENVAAELNAHGRAVDLRPCRSAKDLKGYGAVVIGSAIYMFHLHKDAVRFFNRHQKYLSSMPVAVFAGGAYGPNYTADSIDVRKNLDAELAKFPWLRPASTLLVGGRFDPARLLFPYNLIPALKQAPADDARDWGEIRAWASGLPRLLAMAADQPSPA